MAVHPNLQPDADERGSLRDAAESSRVEKSFTLKPHSEIEEVAEMLAQAGGGSLSLDLALDLVLNEMVEEARLKTEATGAVIALERDGEMLCRATTGNAPQLGMRVAASDLSAASLKKQEVQLCSDTETDARVDSDACRRLGVRSMLIAPVGDNNGSVGIVEVFSVRPNAFSEGDIKTMQALAKKISNSVRATFQRSQAALIAPEDSEALSQRLRTVLNPVVQVKPQADVVVPEERTSRDVLTSILVGLVIATSVLLGILVGVHFTMKGLRAGKSGPSSLVPLHKAEPAQSRAGDGTATSPTDSAKQANPGNPAKAATPPAGGLVVTENGKVIFRTAPLDSGSAGRDSSSRLLHRVDPQYPEAARSQHIEGPVVLEAQVLGDGTVGNIAILKGDPVLAEAARQAVKQWKYQPYVVDGRPVSRQERITVKFRLASS